MAKRKNRNHVVVQERKRQSASESSKVQKKTRKPPMSKKKRERMEKRLNTKRHKALDKLRNSWEDILTKYSDKNLVTDVVDLETGDVVEDHGHLATLETNGFSMAVWAGPNQRYHKPPINIHEIIQRDYPLDLEDLSEDESDDDLEEEQSVQDDHDDDLSDDDLVLAPGPQRDSEPMPQYEDEESDIDDDWVAYDEEEDDDEEEEEYVAPPRLPTPKRSKVWKPPRDDPLVDRNSVWNTGLSDLESDSEPAGSEESESEPEPDPIDIFALCGEVGYHCGRIFCFKCL